MAFIAGVADANGYGWAIAKVRPGVGYHTGGRASCFLSRLLVGVFSALAEAGATIAVGTWPPVLGLFKASLDAGKLAEDLKTSTGESWKLEKVGPNWPRQSLPT